MTTTPTPPEASLASRASRAVLWNTIFVPLRMIAEVASTLLKLTVLPVSSFGLLALISGAANGLGTWIDLGTARALPKYIPETDRAGGPRATARLIAVIMAAQLAMMALVVGGLLLLRDAYLGDMQHKVEADTALPEQARAALNMFITQYGGWLLAAVIALLFFGICYDVLMAYLSSFFKQRAWNSINLAAGLFPRLLTAVVIIIGWDILGVLGAMVLAPALATLLAFWQVMVLRRSLVTDAPPLDATQPLLPSGFVRYSGVSFLMTISDYLASRSFVILLAKDIGDVAMLWAGASVVEMALGYLFSPMVGLQVPLFARVRAGEGGTLQGAYQSLVRLQVLLLIPGAVGLMLLAQPIFAVMTPKYIEAAPLVWVLTPCLFLECLLTTAHNALIVYEKLRIIVLSRLIALSVVPLVLVLAPTLGIVGAALAFGLARVLSGMWATGNGYRLLGLRWPWRFTLRVIAASSVMGVVIAGLTWLLPDPALAQTIPQRLILAALLGGVGLVGGGAFFAVLRLTGGLDPNDRQHLDRLKLPGKRWVVRLLGGA